MRIAIVGAGIAGLTCAHLLHPEHEITVFEADERPGGHTRTVDGGDRPAASSTWTPASSSSTTATTPASSACSSGSAWRRQPSTMSFSVSDGRGEFEYNGASANGLFARRSSLVRPSFHRMVRDLLRFNREAPALIGPERLGAHAARLPRRGRLLARVRRAADRAAGVGGLVGRPARPAPLPGQRCWPSSSTITACSASAGGRSWRAVTRRLVALRRAPDRPDARPAAAVHAGGARRALRRTAWRSRRRAAAARSASTR